MKCHVCPLHVSYPQSKWNVIGESNERRHPWLPSSTKSSRASPIVSGADLLNEPHGRATWGHNDPSTDWNRAAEDMILHITTQHPDFTGLFFVEGET